jgi:hypothetical protein
MVFQRENLYLSTALFQISADFLKDQDLQKELPQRQTWYQINLMLIPQELNYSKKAESHHPNPTGETVAGYVGLNVLPILGQ